MHRTNVIVQTNQLVSSDTANKWFYFQASLIIVLFLIKINQLNRQGKRK